MCILNDVNLLICENGLTVLRLAARKRARQEHGRARLLTVDAAQPAAGVFARMTQPPELILQILKQLASSNSKCNSD